MLITKKLGNISASAITNKSIDKLSIEWHEAERRILHKTTQSGIDVTLKFLNRNPDFKEGDVLWQDENTIIIVEIIPTECIVITPGSLIVAAALSYEIGNRHVPLFYEGVDLLIPYDVPLFNLLQASGYSIRIEEKKLVQPFKTTVLPHLQIAGDVSITGKKLHLSKSL